MGRVNILVVPHYVNSLRYFDKLYHLLIKENIEMVYVIRNDKKMIDFCVNNERLYEIISFQQINKIKLFVEPYYRYKFKKKIDEVINKYSPQLILQPNDTNIYNDTFVKAAKKRNIITFGLQWAITAPEDFYFRNKSLKNLKNSQNRSIFTRVIKNFFNKFFKILNYPLLAFTGLYSNHKLSLAQGESDIFGVINSFTKRLLINQGVKKEKILVLGSLHYDDAITTIRVKSKLDLREKYNLLDKDVVIVYFSQPFYKKDITLLGLDDQLNYLDELLKTIDNFYKKNNKHFKLLLKLHPAENLEDYELFSNRPNTLLLEQANNYELILLSDICLSQHSTILQAALVMQKPTISLNILKLEATTILSKVIGIESTVNTWKEFHECLEYLEEHNYSPLNNFNLNNIVLDEKSYYRTIKLIKILVGKTK